jgi:hypothetical protein
MIASMGFKASNFISDVLLVSDVPLVFSLLHLSLFHNVDASTIPTPLVSLRIKQSALHSPVESVSFSRLPQTPSLPLTHQLFPTHILPIHIHHHYDPNLSSNRHSSICSTQLHRIRPHQNRNHRFQSFNTESSL